MALDDLDQVQAHGPAAEAIDFPFVARLDCRLEGLLCLLALCEFGAFHFGRPSVENIDRADAVLNEVGGPRQEPLEE
jgi:hypothetical protein